MTIMEEARLSTERLKQVSPTRNQLVVVVAGLVYHSE